MYKLASVKYLNSLPFSYALDRLEQRGLLNWERALPSECAGLLKNDFVDIALLPVGALCDFEKLYGITPYCIGSNSAVKTVRLFSNYKFDEIEQIVLSDASRTSNILLKILVENYWKWNGILIKNNKDQEIRLKTARVIIGDEVFVSEHQYKYSMDLGLEWNKFTGLPFVFAIWVSKFKIDEVFETALTQAFAEDLNYFLVNEDFNQYNIPAEILSSYFKDCISYDLTEQKRKAIEAFLKLAGFRNPMQN
ncbi:MAG: menaquinone biosynthesis protein [Saprospiraceae bacterium]|nr:menaquinone biosynthesis protein [Saprospiraceae bacterium]